MGNKERPYGAAEILLSAKHVTAYRGDTCVFQDLTLDLERGTQTAILGPNGSGKSTLVKLLTGEVHPVPRDETVLRLFGLDRWSVWDIRARLGIVSHDLQRDFPEEATGLEVLLSGFRSSLGVYPYQTFDFRERNRAGEVAEQVGVAQLADRHFATMSTGEQRRCLLGRALVHDPEALVLDEPTSGLDLQACFQYLATIRKLMSTGTTILLVTHHIHEIPPEIERVILLGRGRVLADGSKDSILTGPRLSRLFETPLEVGSAQGFFYAVPAPSSER